MAENKNTVVVYRDWIDVFEALSDDEAGRLIKHFFRYVNDKHPEAPDRLTEISFIPIERVLKKDLRKWDNEVNKKSRGGKMGNFKKWHPSLYNQIIEGKLTLEDAEIQLTNHTRSHTDNMGSHTITPIADTDTVTVTVGIKDNISSSKTEEVDFYLSKKRRKLTGKRLETFLIFWDKFNYKSGKAEAADAWIDIPTLTTEICNQIYVAAEIEAKNRVALKESGKTPKMAQGWLTARRYEDEILTKKVVVSKKTKNDWG